MARRISRGAVRPGLLVVAGVTTVALALVIPDYRVPASISVRASTRSQTYT
jgi:hypothetical protein